ncbi:CRISPR-associated protein Cas4 [Domibacillus indicus]|uniref:CRISPR-associated protein Cas4 n=1 Tax=Domibacillus indicus TaxID=1437523 RepID=UPI000617E7D2|nr:CRISPR-associated protein Cas4 [Domibacillus indicus]
MQNQTIGGVELQYYALCKRKLWLYKHGIRMEDESDKVLEGSVLHDTSYPKLMKKEIIVDGQFKIDAIDGEYVREVKNSSKMKQADRLQMLFYLYQLQLRRIHKIGLVSYPKERKTNEIHLGEEEIKEIKEAIADVYTILEQAKPIKPIKVPYCKSCSYHSFCYATEVDDDDA